MGIIAPIVIGAALAGTAVSQSKKNKQAKQANSLRLDEQRKAQELLKQQKGAVAGAGEKAKADVRARQLARSQTIISSPLGVGSQGENIGKKEHLRLMLRN